MKTTESSCVLYNFTGKFNPKASEHDEGVERFYMRESLVEVTQSRLDEEAAQSKV